MGYIYKIYNDINNKVYIGQTKGTIEERFKQHLKKVDSVDGRHYPLYNAIKKYGKEHFFIEALEETEDLDNREYYWIKHFDSYYNGYNATFGGEGSQTANYNLIAELYQSGKTCREIAEELKIDRGTVSRGLKAKRIQILSNTETSKKIKSKKIGQYDKETLELIQIYPSIKEAAKALNKGHSHISNCANGIRKSAYGYIWKFIEE